MKTKLFQPNPKPAFRIGDTARLNRYLPPILSGTNVIINDVHTGRHGTRYQITTAEYPARPVWAEESDLQETLE